MSGLDAWVGRQLAEAEAALGAGRGDQARALVSRVLQSLGRETPRSPREAVDALRELTAEAETRPAGPVQGGRVAMFGGVGVMESEYEAAAEAAGFELIYREKKQFRGTPPEVCAVLVVVPVCSHPLRSHAQEVAARVSAPIIYMRTASISELRTCLEQVKKERAACAGGRT